MLFLAGNGPSTNLQQPISSFIIDYPLRRAPVPPLHKVLNQSRVTKFARAAAAGWEFEILFTLASYSPPSTKRVPTAFSPSLAHFFLHVGILGPA